MSAMDDWLAQWGLEKYVDLFAEHEIDLEVLVDINDDELREIGLPLGGSKEGAEGSKTLAEGVFATPIAVAESSVASTEIESPKDAEHRQLTVMFCDLADSTALSESIDAEDYRDLVSAFQEVATKTIRANDGFVARYMGDGLLAYFGFPNAPEDDPIWATRAGLELVDAVGTIDSAHPLEVRVGIATGMVLVGDIIGEGASEEAAVLGSTPNLAARLQSAASPNTVLISRSTHALLRDQLETTEVASLRLKGFEETVRAFMPLRPRTLRELSGSRRYATPLIGRVVELAMLERAWENVCSGEGQLLLLLGEAGIGKSRLIHAFRESIPREARTLIEWHCSAHHQSTANYPAREHMYHFITRELPESKDVTNRLSAFITDLGLDQSERVPVVSVLAGFATSAEMLSHLNPNQIRLQLINAQVQLLCALADHQPVLFTIEDVHWADPSTLEVLREMIDAIRERRVLIVMTARPEFDPQWEESSVSQTHRLHNLSRRETTSLIQNLVLEQDMTDELVEQIVERTDGVPLFIEELTKNVLESSSQQTVPSSLQDLLMARLDRLGSGRDLAQAASLIGRTFTAEAVAAIVERSPDEVAASLQPLVDTGLVRQVPSGRYEFKHALIRDSAYSSLPRRSRVVLHRRYADFLASEGGGSGQPELLARHYQEAGDASLAIKYWSNAGDRALAQAAQSEAVNHLDEARRLFEALPEAEQEASTELSILIRLGQAQFSALGGAAPQTRATFNRAARLAEQEADFEGLFLARYGDHVGYVISGEIESAIANSAKNMRLAEAMPDIPWAKPVAIRSMASANYMAGNLQQARNASLEVIGAKEVMESGPRGFAHDPYIVNQSTLAHIEWALGLPATALERATQILNELDLDAANLNTVLHTLTWYVFLTMFCRAEARSEHAALQLSNRARSRGGNFWGHLGTVGTGIRHVRSGSVEIGLGLLRQGAQSFRETGAKQHLPCIDSWIAEGEIAGGDPEVGLEVLDESAKLIEQTQQYFYLPESRRLRGAAYVAMGESKLAQSAFEDAIAVCQAQGAKSVELRATTDLARLLVTAGDVEQGIRRLKALYASFSEGHDFPDWREARALLAELETRSNGIV